MLNCTPLGQRGTIVEIKGEHLYAGGNVFTEVSLGGIPVLEIVEGSNTCVRVIAGGHSVNLTTPGDVVLTTDNDQKVSRKDRKCQLLHPATPHYPFPRGKFHTRGNTYTVGF